MKTIWIVLISCVATAAIVGGGTYYFVNAKATKDKDVMKAQVTDSNNKLADAQSCVTSNTSSSTLNNPAATPNATTNWKAYSNSTYGFSFTFPNDNWKNYKVFEYTPTDKSVTKDLFFAVPTTDTTWSELNSSGGNVPKGYFSPMVITVYTPAQWATAKNQPLTGNSVGQNSNYVFTITSSQDAPTDLHSAGFDVDVNTIKRSFKAF